MVEVKRYEVGLHPILPAVADTVNGRVICTARAFAALLNEQEAELERLSTELQFKCDADWDPVVGGLNHGSKPCQRLESLRTQLDECRNKTIDECVTTVIGFTDGRFKIELDEFGLLDKSTVEQIADHIRILKSQPAGEQDSGAGEEGDTAHGPISNARVTIEDADEWVED